MCPDGKLGPATNARLRGAGAVHEILQYDRKHGREHDPGDRDLSSLTEQPGPELLGDTGSLAPGDGRRSPSWPRSSLYAAAAIPLFYLPALFFGAGPNLRLLLRDKRGELPPSAWRIEPL